MSNERIDLTKELEWLHRLVKTKQVPDLGKHDVIVDSGWIEGLIAELKRCYERIDELEKEPQVTIDEWDIPSQGPCVTVRYNGREYVGTLEEWDTSEEE